MLMRTLLVSLLLSFVPLQPVAAQALATGRITGTVVDAVTGTPLHAVVVQVVGTTQGVATDIQGRYRLSGVTAGTVTLHFRRIGYAAKTVTGLMLAPGAAIEQDVALPPASATLSEIVVTAGAERGTINEAIDQQRTAVGVVNAITAEQIGKSPDGDAAQAMQRVSGVTVQDGKYVFVRGLGERYTTSSLNGARMPSPEPEKRVVPLDMFPSGLLQSITTAKTFTPDLPGDFSGAQVDIKTKEFPTRRSLTLQLGSGLAEGATGSPLTSAPAAGGENWAMASDRRALPELVRSVGNFQNITLNAGDKNRLVGAFRDAWTPTLVTAAALVNANWSIGGNDPILFGHRLGYLVSGSLSSGTSLEDKQQRALAGRGTVKGATFEQDRFDGATATRSVRWGGLANLSTLLGGGSRLFLSALYNRTADNEARVETGSFENEGIRAKITRMRYVERGVHSLQLAGEHAIGRSNRIDWYVTASGVRRYEPDRSEFVQVIEKDAPAGPDVLRWNNTGNGGAVRTFSDLAENSREGSVKYQLEFDAGAHPVVVRVGALARNAARDADSRAYAIGAHGFTNAMRELPAEQIFDGRFSTPTSDYFDIGPLSQGGSYTARDRLAAGFAMLEVGLLRGLRLIGGARYESDHLEVDAFSTLGAPVYTTKDWNDLLPAIALTAQLNESQQLRLAASRTLARPEYRELSPITSRDVLNGDDTKGNENLLRTNIVNVDARWEWYPGAGELISVALFAKKFDHPIERVYQSAGSGTRTVFYANAQGADNYGIEFEGRKDLGFLGRALAPYSVFANVTVMRSMIHLGDSTRSSSTNLNRAMVGQAPYVINTGITYTSTSGRSSATLLYNRVGARIEAAGDAPLPDVVEQPRDVVDLSLRLAVTGSVSARLDGKNLLDAPYRTTQGTVTRERFQAGRTIQIGLLWQP